LIIISLFGKPDEVVIEASIRIIVVSEFGKIAHAIMGLLEDGNANGHIVGSLEILAVLVLQVPLLDIHEKLGVEGPQVTRHEGIAAVSVLLDSLGGEGTGVAHPARSTEEVGVD
jgi:hypothetical protein